jgi:hypothetical protein
MNVRTNFQPEIPVSSAGSTSPIEDISSIPGSMLVDSLEDLPYPLAREALVATAGHRRLRFPNGRSVELAELLHGVERELFESMIDVVEALRLRHGSED